MKQLVKTVALALTFSLVLGTFNACKRDADPKPKSEVIARTWRVTQVDEIRSGTITTVYQQGGSTNSANYDAYRLNFTAAGAFSRTESTGVPTTGTWQFDSSQSKITFDNGAPNEVSVIELSENSFVISYQVSSKTGTREVLIRLIPA